MVIKKKIIVIDARVIVYNKNHGISRHTDELIKNLFELSTDIHFILLVTKKSPYLKIKLPKNFSLQILYFGWMSLLGQLEIWYILKKISPNLYHTTSFILPFLSKIPFIATIHDLIHLVMQDDYSWLHKIYYNYFIAYKIKQAKAIITVSEFSKSEIIKYYKVQSKNVFVTYNGISSIFLKSLNEIKKEKILLQFKRNYELPDKFILSIANQKKHKNLINLVEAYCMSNFEESLVLICGFNLTLLNIAKKHNKKHRLIFVRFVPDQYLPLLYASAKCFIFPSFYEGFGLPPLEACACATPVISSNRTSLPEILKNSALYVDPDDVLAINKAIKEILTYKINITENIKEGLQIVKNYSWQNMALNTLIIYQNLLKEE